MGSGGSPEGRVTWWFCPREGEGFAVCVFILYNRCHNFPFCLYIIDLFMIFSHAKICLYFFSVKLN